MKLYSIGQASAMIGIPVKTLRYYESIGLCSPSLIDEENGYRYYSIDDIFRLDLIRCLGRQLGMPLKTIQQFFQESADPRTLKSYLTEQSSQLSAQINELELRREFIDRKLAAMEQREKSPLYRVYREELGERELWVKRETIESMQDSMMKARRLAAQERDWSWSEVYILHEEGGAVNTDKREAVIGLMGSSAEELCPYTLAAGSYYSIDYQFRDGAAEASVAMLLRQIAEDGYRTVGPMVNIGSLIDSFSGLSRDYVIKTQYRVEPM